MGPRIRLGGRQSRNRPAFVWQVSRHGENDLVRGQAYPKQPQISSGTKYAGTARRIDSWPNPDNFGIARHLRECFSRYMFLPVKATLTLCALSLVLPLAACGSEDEEAASIVRSYLQAVAEGNGHAACDLLTGEQQRHVLDQFSNQLPELGAVSCAHAVEMTAENFGRDETTRLAAAEVTATVTGDTATATIEGATETAQLTRTEAGWLISGGLFSEE